MNNKELSHHAQLQQRIYLHDTKNVFFSPITISYDFLFVEKYSKKYGAFRNLMKNYDLMWNSTDQIMKKMSVTSQ